MNPVEASSCELTSNNRMFTVRTVVLATWFGLLKLG